MMIRHRHDRKPMRERCDAADKGAGTAFGANGKTHRSKTPRGRTIPSKKMFAAVIACRAVAAAGVSSSIQPVPHSVSKPVRDFILSHLEETERTIELRITIRDNRNANLFV